MQVEAAEHPLFLHFLLVLPLHVLKEALLGHDIRGKAARRQPGEHALLQGASFSRGISFAKRLLYFRQAGGPLL